MGARESVKVFLLLTILCAISDLGTSRRLGYRRTGPCRATLQGFANIYNYRATQSQFDGANKESVDISCGVTIFCISAGRFGRQRAHLFGMKIANTRAGGKLFEKDAADRALQAEVEELEPELQGKAVTSFDEAMAGWFRFVQTDNGAIPAVYHSKEEDAGNVNFKKRICASMQANFRRTAARKEADPTSAHIARYTNDASMEEVTEQGTVRQHRVVTSDDVSDYASHIEPDQVKSKAEDDIEYKQGVLLSASGKSTILLMPETDVSPEKDVEADILEADTGAERRKRQASEEQANTSPTYDPSKKMNHFEAGGSFSLTLAKQEKLLRRKRSAIDHLELPEAMESSLLAFINHTHMDLEHMRDIHSELGSIPNVLQTLHKNNEGGESDDTHKLRDLLELEAKYGPLPGYTPAIDAVLNHLTKILHSEKEEDIATRSSIYFMITPEGSLRSQEALLKALDSETDEEERQSVIMYIAFVHSPRPEFVAQLEDRIGFDIHSNDPLLLAYGCLIARATPELQQRMTLYLLHRLPHAQENEASLIHHLHSLGNAGAPSSASTIISYLQHPDENVQLTTISALRFLANETLVQKALTDLLSQPNVPEQHIESVMSSLQYGMEHARENRLQKPYSNELATALVLAAIEHSNGQFDSAIIKYLLTVNTPESKQLAHLLQIVQFEDPSSNSTRVRRGTDWASSKSVYNLVESLKVRKEDKRKYGSFSKSYIWGKKMGSSDGNVQVAVGGFVGVSEAGDYKVFAHAVAEGNCFGRCYRAADFKLLRQKTKSSTRSILYVMVAGKTLSNIDKTQSSSVCKKYDTSLFKKKTYSLFKLSHTIFVYVGNLKFTVKGSVEMSGGAFMEFCDNRGSVTATLGLTPTVTFKVTAGASANILGLAKGFIDVTGTFNYQVSPELSSMFCYKGSQIRVQNCGGIYHQWKNNKINLDVRYQTREMCWYGPCLPLKWTKKKKFKAASNEWSIRGTKKTALWEVCDQRVNC